MSQRKFFFMICMSLVGLLVPLQSKAAVFNMMLESDSNEPGGSELFLATYDSPSDLISGSLSSSSYSQINIASNFSVGGLAYDGQYQLMLESDSNLPGGSELFLATYDSYSDLISGSLSSSSYSQINIASNFSVGGLAYDGQYQLMLESDSNEPGGSELFLATYDSFSDLISGSLSSSSYSQINIASNFSVGGLAYDGQYQLMLESDSNLPGGSELFLATYDSYSDLISGSLSSSSYSQINIASNFSVGGLTSTFADETPDIPPVPVPAAVWLFGSALIGLLGFARRRKVGPLS